MNSTKKKFTISSWNGSRSVHEEVRHSARCGHHLFPRHAHRPRRPPRRLGPTALPPDLPPARLGRARPPGHPLLAAGRLNRAHHVRERGYRRHRFHRHHQPARDHHRVGPHHRRAHHERHRLAVPPHGAHGGGHRERPSYRSRDHGAHGTRARRLLLRQQARLDLRRGARRSRSRRGGGACFRHRGQLARLEAHRRGRARHGRDQCEPDHALQHPREALGSLPA